MDKQGIISTSRRALDLLTNLLIRADDSEKVLEIKQCLMAIMQEASRPEEPLKPEEKKPEEGKADDTN